MEGGLRIKANQEQTLSGKEEFIRRGRGGGEEFGTIENVLEGEMSDEEGSKSRGTASEKQGERGRVSEGGRVGGAQKSREEKGAIVRQLRPFHSLRGGYMGGSGPGGREPIKKGGARPALQ